jgi:hypothetical protein
VHRIPDHRRTLGWRSSLMGIGWVVIAAAGLAVAGLLLALAMPALVR